MTINLGAGSGRDLSLCFQTDTVYGYITNLCGNESTVVEPNPHFTPRTYAILSSPTKAHADSIGSFGARLQIRSMRCKRRKTAAGAGRLPTFLVRLARSSVVI